jgi:hypothetical protein
MLHESDSGTRSGWDGDPVEGWRVFTAAIFWQALARSYGTRKPAAIDKTYADWVLPWLNPSRLSAERADWNRFFYYEVQAEAMPRNWLRSTIHAAQYSRRVGHGNPIDEQHTAYLLDADLFLTGDTRLTDLLKAIIPFCPVEVAAPRLVPAGSRDVVAAIESALE